MDDLDQLKRLAGINNKPNWTAYEGINVSITGAEKAQLQREHKIEPGTDEWFKLWFSRPYLTGEKPI
jgi:hypothetical protein